MPVTMSFWRCFGGGQSAGNGIVVACQKKNGYVYWRF
jgi:hypothetical protein